MWGWCKARYLHKFLVLLIPQCSRHSHWYTRFSYIKLVSTSRSTSLAHRAFTNTLVALLLIPTRCLSVLYCMVAMSQFQFIPISTRIFLSNVNVPQMRSTSLIQLPSYAETYVDDNLSFYYYQNELKTRVAYQTAYTLLCLDWKMPTFATLILGPLYISFPCGFWKQLFNSISALIGKCMCPLFVQAYTNGSKDEIQIRGKQHLQSNIR